MARQGRISLGEQVYRALRRDLAAGELTPTERLAEEPLARAYGVSRTPVREALARLVADGTVERHPDGLYPRRPTLEELDELFELRIILEMQGIQRVHAEPERRYHRAVLEQQLEIWQRWRRDLPAPDAALITADEQFHTAVLGAAGNSALATALDDVHLRIRPIRGLDPPSEVRVAAMTAAHVQLLQHLLAGDLDLARPALLAHISHSRAHILARAREARSLTRLGQALRD
ncbi:GntR family transcriptional regulator [Nocardia stercoris]|uniref:GntR family transcriptional regulator n=1 Tax=Nocardia stercoris TaxID=2483361 RepID=A0A3M2L081_9NOCA|nr:GntR family transcriptional regulator [Nocardia stercoris]RMI30804.1 GntR family transcriptional regulator [Nocardia stercoris]